MGRPPKVPNITSKAISAAAARRSIDINKVVRKVMDVIDSNESSNADIIAAAKLLLDKTVPSLRSQEIKYENIGDGHLSIEEKLMLRKYLLEIRAAKPKVIEANIERVDNDER